MKRLALTAALLALAAPASAAALHDHFERVPCGSLCSKPPGPPKPFTSPPSFSIKVDKTVPSITITIKNGQGQTSVLKTIAPH